VSYEKYVSIWNNNAGFRLLFGWGTQLACGKSYRSEI